MIDTPIPDEALTPRQRQLRDGVVIERSDRTMQRLVKLEQDHSALQSKLYELIRLRDMLIDSQFSRELIDPLVAFVIGWIDLMEERLADSQATIDQLRKQAR